MSIFCAWERTTTTVKSFPGGESTPASHQPARVAATLPAALDGCTRPAVKTPPPSWLQLPARPRCAVTNQARFVASTAAGLPPVVAVASVPVALRFCISIHTLATACFPSGLPLNDGAQADYQCVSCCFCALSRFLTHDWSSTGYCCAVFCSPWCCCTWFLITVCWKVWCKLLLRCLQLAKHALLSGVALLRHFRFIHSDSDL